MSVQTNNRRCWLLIREGGNSQIPRHVSIETKILISESVVHTEQFGNSDQMFGNCDQMFGNSDQMFGNGNQMFSAK